MPEGASEMSALELFLLLIGAALYVPMAWQDFMERSISLGFLLLPYANFVFTALLFHSTALLVSFLPLLAAVALYALGMLALGDVLASPLIFAEAFAAEYVAVMLLAVVLTHAFYGIASRKEKRWWGRMPLAGYIGAADILGVAAFIIAELL